MVVDASALLAILEGESTAQRFVPAALEFNDCFAYAPASALGEPLMFVCLDFSVPRLNSEPLSLHNRRIKTIVFWQPARN